MTLETVLASIPRRLGPVGAVVMAILLMILGIVVIMHPVVLVWLVGIGLILAGAAVLTLTFMLGRQSSL